MSRGPEGKPIRKLRCAVYTRKSTEEGLDKEFNSLQAQREACEAYIASQRSEGWALVRDAYDDGGFSGGTLERPALKQLLADIEEGLVDVVVVYKIDRLSRSLMDFSKLVEVFDRAGVTFVSRHPVVQHHDLDGAAHAQHPALLRPVRARGHRRAGAGQDQGVAAEGHVDGRQRAARLRRAEPEARGARADAAVVRSMFERFLRVGSATVLARELRAEGVLTTKGRPIDKGYLYKCLSNRTYLGLAIHKGTAYPGEHAAIIDQDLWDKVHAILAENARTRSARTRAQTPALLKGLIFGPTGAAMSPTHTRKGNRLYRYYVSQDVLQHGRDACPIGRVPAAEIEAAVIDQLRGVFRQPEIVVGTWRAARAEQDDITEDEAREALTAARSAVGRAVPRRAGADRAAAGRSGGCARRGRRRALPHERHRCARPRNREEGRMTEDDRTVTVRIPLVFKKHGGRKTVISPDGHVWEPSEPLVDSALVRALARAFRWQRLLDEGVSRDLRRLGAKPNGSASPMSAECCG